MQIIGLEIPAHNLLVKYKINLMGLLILTKYTIHNDRLTRIYNSTNTYRYATVMQINTRQFIHLRQFAVQICMVVAVSADFDSRSFCASLFVI